MTAFPNYPTDFDSAPADDEALDETLDDAAPESPEADEVEVDDEPEDKGEGKAKGGRPASSSPRAAYRRAFRKTREIDTAKDRVVEIAAKLTGHDSEDTEAILLSILTGDRRATLQPVTDLRDVRTADQFEMGVLIVSFGKDRYKALWTLLGYLGHADGTLPAADPKAALQIAKAVLDVTDEDMADLDGVDELLKKA